tara:strand:- start:38620 stop:39291 length:672 start_codon:yes stop_codon:yes gene_type:complete
MADVTLQVSQAQPPDRRLLAQLTKDPKLIRYLELLGQTATITNPTNNEIILLLINDANETAGSAQGTANLATQLAQALEAGLEYLDGQGQPMNALLRAVQRKLDDIEASLLDIRPPIFPTPPTPTPPFAPSVVNVTAAYSVLAAPPYQPLTVRADATAAGFTVTLPAVPTALQLVNIKKVDATANVVTVSGGAINIDGGLTAAIGSQYTNIQVQFNGATWDVL